MSTPLYLIDASIYIFRSYFSLPDQWHCPEGNSVNALLGYGQFLLKFLNSARPKYIAAAFDESLGSCFRNEIYSDYKSSRGYPDEALALQLAACQGLTELMGIASLASARYEADDLIASLADSAQRRGDNVIIVSSDKDLGQLLVQPHDQLWDFASNRKLDRKSFLTHYGVRPEQLVDYLALVGDPVDDIPGVPGIGKKTAIALLGQFDSVDAIYADIDANLGGVARCSIRGAKGLAQRLVQYRSQLNMAKQLVRLARTAPLADDVCLAWQPPSLLTVRYYLDEFGLGAKLQPQLEQCYWWK